MSVLPGTSMSLLCILGNGGQKHISNRWNNNWPISRGNSAQFICTEMRKRGKLNYGFNHLKRLLLWGHSIHLKVNAGSDTHQKRLQTSTIISLLCVLETSDDAAACRFRLSLQADWFPAVRTQEESGRRYNQKVPGVFKTQSTSELLYIKGSRAGQSSWTWTLKEELESRVFVVKQKIQGDDAPVCCVYSWLHSTRQTHTIGILLWLNITYYYVAIKKRVPG